MKSQSSKSYLAIALFAIETSTAFADATIGPGFTGAWFDPAQSGHGLFLEILPDNRIQAAWFAFNPAADVNGGGLSIQDIFDFLNAWFVGC